MKRLTAITALCTLFTSAFVAGKGTPGAEAIRSDSSFAPAYYAMAANGMYSSPDEAVELARSAYRLDTANKWYHQFYGQALIYADRYDEALKVYRRLQIENPKDPDNYRILAALYEQTKSPVQAIITLDSAELRFGRIPLLGEMKRRLLLATGQVGRAIEEARREVEAAPYEARLHAVLATLYGADRKDSLARAEFDEALRIDSTNVETLMMLADFHAERQDYGALLAATRRIFLSDKVPLETKIRRFEQFTADTRFYREYYFQLNDLATTLAIRYPDDPGVTELYASHLIASGELEQALALYKLRLADRPPAEKFFRTVIDIESYLQRPDSVDKYVHAALALFPDRVDFHMSKGHVMSYSKQYDKALDAYRESLDYAATDSLRSVIWGMIGDTWHQKGNYAYFLSIEGRDLERALSMASRVTALEDDNPTYLDTYAWVLYKLGRTDEAKKILQRAVVLDGQRSPALLAHYGDILYALGERFMAEIYWRQALEKGYSAELIEPRMQQAANPEPEAKKR